MANCMLAPEVMKSTLQEAIEQEQLRPAGWPKLEPIKMEPGQALEYSAVFEVYPEIGSVKLDNITIEKPAVEVADEDVDNLIDKIRLQRVTWNEVDRAAEDSDQVIKTLERTDGKYGLCISNHQLELKQNTVNIPLELFLLSA